MSSLKYVEKIQLEKILRMERGYVLGFSDRSFADFFQSFNIKIDDEKYTKLGSSKANRLRTFWELEADELVGKVIEELLEVSLIQYDPCVATDPDFLKAKTISFRLRGKKETYFQEDTEEDFLKKEFKDISLKTLDISPDLLSILEKRLEEATKCLNNNIPLSCIFLIGSLLEGILFNAASKSPQKFNQSNSSPKDKNGKVKPFRDWDLANFIDISHDIGLLKLDVKKFSNPVRYFRNYIHPREQMNSNFHPDLHTANICFQVLRAAIADLSGDR